MSFQFFTSTTYKHAVAEIDQIESQLLAYQKESNTISDSDKQVIELIQQLVEEAKIALKKKKPARAW